MHVSREGPESRKLMIFCIYTYDCLASHYHDSCIQKGMKQLESCCLVSTLETLAIYVRRVMEQDQFLEQVG